MEILNGVFFNNEDFATLTELAERDDKTIKQLRKEISELEATLESVCNDRTAWRKEAVNAKNSLEMVQKELAETKKKLEVSIKLGTLFMIAAAKE